MSFSNSLENMEKEYNKFYNNLVKSVSNYIALNRELVMSVDPQLYEMTIEDIKKCVNDSEYLKRYLSYDDFRLKIDKIIVSKEDNVYSSKKLVLQRLGYGIKKIRKSNNLKINEFAKIIHVSESYISKIENCHIKNPPKYMVINRIMTIFNCNEEYIFGIIDSPKCSGDLLRKPIIMTTVNDNFSILSSFTQYSEITDMLITVYKTYNAKKIEKLSTFLKELTEDIN